MLNETSCDGPHQEAAETFLLRGDPPRVIVHFDPPARENPTVTGERRRMWAWIRSWWPLLLGAAATVGAIALIG